MTQTAPGDIGASAYSLEPTDHRFTLEELQLAFRNRGMPLEALRYEVTPTGLHYLVIHWDIPEVDTTTWRLEIGGLVRRPLVLTMDQIMARPSLTIPVTFECAGNGRGRLSPRPLSLPWLHEAVSTALWTGTPLWPLLEEAGIGADTVELIFRGADEGIQGGEVQTYARSLAVSEVQRSEVLLAYAMNGHQLPPQHGYPLRLVVPGWYGMTSVKWLRSIEAVARPFSGYQQAVSYRYQRDADDPGEPVTRMRVRALMSPPGMPDFLTRGRFLDGGRVTLAGRAWSGHGSIDRVEVSVDGSWADARLGAVAVRTAWRSWMFDWDAPPGDHELACRATDDAGNVQPLEQPWNYLGMGNNLVQRVFVSVR